jgi:hypothetical protein
MHSAIQPLNYYIQKFKNPVTQKVKANAANLLKDHYTESESKVHLPSG